MEKAKEHWEKEMSKARRIGVGIGMLIGLPVGFIACWLI